MPFIAGPICDSKSALPEFMEDSNVVNMYFDERGSYLANYCTSGNGKYYYATGGSQDSNKYLYSIYAKNGTLYYTSNTYNYGNTYHTKLIMEVAGTGTATVKDITLIAPNDVTDTVMRNPIIFPIESNDKMLYILLTSGTNNPVYDVWYSYSLTNGSSTMLTYTSNSNLTWNSPSSSGTTIAIHGSKIYIGLNDSGSCKINSFDTTTASYTRTSVSKFTKDSTISLYELVGSPYIACVSCYNYTNLHAYLWNPNTNTYIELTDTSGTFSKITTTLFPLCGNGANGGSSRPTKSDVYVTRIQPDRYIIGVNSCMLEIDTNTSTVSVVCVKSGFDVVYTYTHMKSGKVICPSQRPEYGLTTFVTDVKNPENLYFIEYAPLSYDGSTQYQLILGLSSSDKIKTMYQVYIQ